LSVVHRFVGSTRGCAGKEERPGVIEWIAQGCSAAQLLKPLSFPRSKTDSAVPF
jgi:hypothetical protein